MEGEQRLMQCEADLVFNPAISMCDFKYNVQDCIDDTNVPMEYEGPFSNGNHQDSKIVNKPGA